MSADVSWIAGVDEAGRGPLAGPVIAAAVVLAASARVPGVRDSKRLSAARREQLSHDIRSVSQAWSLGLATVEEIDRLNILEATMLAMRRALEGLAIRPDVIRVDGNRSPFHDGAAAGPVECVVGGDDLCPAIAAASILAKVERDRLMRELHSQYPGYGFDRHKGYPTKAHRVALRELGATPHHRRSFGPVREALAWGEARPGKKPVI